MMKKTELVRLRFLGLALVCSMAVPPQIASADPTGPTAHKEGVTPAGMSDDTSSDEAKLSDPQRVLQEAKQKGAQEAAAKEADSSDPCKTGAGINASYSCSGAQTVIDTQNITNMVGQTAGSMAVNTIGGIQSMNAAQDGTQSSQLKAAASTQQLGAGMQVGLGAVNAAAGAYMIWQSQTLKSNAQELRNAISGSDSRGVQVQTVDNTSTAKTNDPGVKNGQDGYVAGRNKITDAIITQGVNKDGSKLNDDFNKNNADTLSKLSLTPEQFACVRNPSCLTAGGVDRGTLSQIAAARQTAIDNKNHDISTAVTQTAGTAADQQAAMASKSMGAGIMAAIQGAGQLGSGALNMMAADQMKQAAKQLGKVEGTAFSPTVGNVDPSADSFTNSGTAITPGSDSGSAATTADQTTSPTSGVGLGDPVNIPNLDGGGVAGPAPAAFVAGSPSGGNGSGSGGGGVGGAATAPATPEAEPQARLADQKGGTAGAYSGGGSYTSGGAVGAEKGPDLSGLLAQFLPKKDDDQGKNGIMDFANRSPASEAPYSLLGRDVNLFKRISETMHANYRRGTVGI